MSIEEKPYRGTIIVDACSLFNMEPLTGKSGKNPHGKPWGYLDILPYLAEQGFRIIIPEMVCCEASRLTAKGHSSQHFFETLSQLRHPQIVGFLRAVIAGNYPHISISPAHAPYNVHEYVQSYERAIAQGDKLVSDAKTPWNKSRAMQLARDEIMDFNQKHHTHVGYGDKAILSLLYDINHGVPKSDTVYVLTEDRDLMRDAVATRPDVRIVTVGALIHALHENQLVNKSPCLNTSFSYHTAEKLRIADVENNMHADTPLISLKIDSEGKNLPERGAYKGNIPYTKGPLHEACHDISNLYQMPEVKIEPRDAPRTGYIPPMPPMPKTVTPPREKKAATSPPDDHYFRKLHAREHESTLETLLKAMSPTLGTSGR